MMNRMIRKTANLVVVTLCVTWATFLTVDLLPGDAAHEIAGPTATPAEIGEIRQRLGLDRPILLRYLTWVAGVCKGDLGVSPITQERVLTAIAGRLPVTVELMLFSQILALALALPCGIVSAYRANSGLDKAIGTAAFGFMSVPVFVMSLVFIYLFAIRLRWFPATGFIPLSQGFWPNLRSLTLPGLSIALVEWVPLMRVLRSDMIATLKEDHILVARAKGLSDRHILFRHALPPSLFTLITLLGIQVGHLIGGALIVEIIFSLPGVGRLLVGALYGRDVVMVQGCILLITLSYVGINFLVDSLYAVLDPRIRYGG